MHLKLREKKTSYRFGLQNYLHTGVGGSILVGVCTHARDSEWMQNFDQHNFTDNFLIFSDPVDFEI